MYVPFAKFSFSIALSPFLSKYSATCLPLKSVNKPVATCLTFSNAIVKLPDVGLGYTTTPSKFLSTFTGATCFKPCVAPAGEINLVIEEQAPSVTGGGVTSTLTLPA